MKLMTRSKLLVLLAAGVAAGLLVAALGNAGTSTITFQAVAGPLTVHAGHHALVFARFQPTKSSGSATHTVLTFTFPSSGVVGNITPDPATSSDCAPLANNQFVIACSVGTVNPGELVKRILTYDAGATLGSAPITVSVAFDAGSGGAKGGGQVNPPAPITLPVQIVDGAGADGTCDVGGATIQTAPVAKGVLQQTTLVFGNSASALPCTYGGVAVQPLSGTPPGGGAPAISSVDGPPFGQPATLTLSFSSLPSPLKNFVLKESHVDPSVANPSDWKDVPSCDKWTLSDDTCVMGYDPGNPIVGHFLFRGLGVDPWYN